MRKDVSVGFDALARNGSPTLQDLERARCVSARLRERGLVAPETLRETADERKVMTTDEALGAVVLSVVLRNYPEAGSWPGPGSHPQS